MHHQSRAISSPPQCRQLKFHLFNYFSNLLLVRFEEALLPRKDENNVFVSVEELRSNSEINRNVVSVVSRKLCFREKTKTMFSSVFRISLLVYSSTPSRFTPSLRSACSQSKALFTHSAWSAYANF